MLLATGAVAALVALLVILISYRDEETKHIAVAITALVAWVFLALQALTSLYHQGGTLPLVICVLGGGLIGIGVAVVIHLL